MKNSSLLRVLHRFAWFLSGIIGVISGYILSDFDSGMYRSAAMNFFEWGWIWAVIFTLLAKRFFFSEEFLESIQENVDSMTPVHTPPSSNLAVSMERQEVVQVIKPLKMPHTPEVVSPEQNMDEHLTEAIEQVVPKEPEKPNWLVAFFSDRPLAKIGGIMLFLGAFFFLSLVWSNVGQVGKILIGLLFGFFLYGIGVWMDKKGHLAESRTLLGVGIAINTLTILYGRWTIGEGTGVLFSDTITLVFLVLNTLFAVATGLVYNSRTFLVFSFVFAYIIPFLVRSESESGILMMLYVAIIGLGGYLLVWLFTLRNEREDDTKWLYRTIIIGNLILLSLTGFGLESNAELLLLVAIILVHTSIGIFLSRKSILAGESLPSLIVSAYIILASAILGVGDGSQGTIFIAFLGIIPLMIYTGIFMLQGVFVIFSWILLLPLVLGLMLFGIFGTGSLLLILLPIILLYGISGIFLVTVLQGIFAYVFYFAISFFLIICAISLDFGLAQISDAERAIISLSSLFLFLLSLWSGLKNKLLHLALTSIISTAVILVFTLVPGWGFSWIFYGAFLGIAFLYPFLFGKNLMERASSLITYLVIANLFMIGELFYLGNGTWFTGESSSLVTLGLIVFMLSVGSLFYSMVLIRTISGGREMGVFTSEEKSHAISLLAIPLSLFSLAVAVTFSESPLVVSAAWILESTVLAYYSGKSKNHLVIIGAIILASIGILRLIPFFDTVSTGDYFALVPVIVIALGLYFSLMFMPKREDVPLVSLYDLIHIFGISMVGYAIMEIVPHTRTGWSLLGLNFFLLLSIWFYTKISSKIVAFWMVFLSVIVFFYHFARVEYLDMSLGPVMVQLIALSVGSLAFWYMKEHHPWGKYAFIYGFIMFLLITSIYVNQITNNIFVVTIYLTIISTLYLLIGINDNIAKYRTIGLYIGTVVLIKILFYDIWAGMDELIIRVVALMTTGGIMIVISQLYGRRVNRPWSEEFAYTNFFSGSEVLHQVDEGVTPDIQSEENTMPFDEIVASDLRAIDVSHIFSLELLSSDNTSILLSKRVGLIRVAYFIKEKLGKNVFSPGELSQVFVSILPHIKSTLPKNDLDTMLSKIETWIKEGGTIVFQEKKIHNEE